MDIYNIVNKKPVCPNCGYILTLDKICTRCYNNIWYSITSDKENIIIKLKNDIDITITENIIMIQKEYIILNIDLIKIVNQFDEVNKTVKVVSYVADNKTRNLNLRTGDLSIENKEYVINQTNKPFDVLPWHKKIWYAIKEVMLDLERSTNNNFWKKENS